jgi:lysophospholipid acyltransferase (LPLAT)-like uncharacterized protein
MLLKIIPAIAYLIIYVVSKTLRLKITGAKQIIEAKKTGKNFIFAFWHNQFFIMPYYYVKKIGRSPISVLTSKSKDGEYISRLLYKFGFSTTRGSTSLGGETALRLLIKEIEKGNDVAVTPDGPRGPRHIIQEGIITLSSVTGCPIVLAGYKVKRKKILNTWDKFIIPCPFTSGILTTIGPISIPKNISDSRKEEIRKSLEKTLNLISE